MAYQSVQLDSELSIEKIYTIHYYEYQNDFYFSGERHNFWEFQCVDKGSAEIVTDNGSPYTEPQSGNLSPAKRISYTESRRQNRTKHHRNFFFL